MVGLILEGGSMRAGFVAGAVMALMDQGMTSFDTAVGVSASVPTLAYFAAGQRRSIEKIWREEIDSKVVHYRNLPLTFVHPSKRWPILDIDHLVDEVFKRKYPLNVSALLNSRMHCGFAATRLSDAKQVILPPDRNSIYKIFKAALAMPGCYPDPIHINGEAYVDGGTADLLPVKYLWNLKIEKLLIILSKPIGYNGGLVNIWGKILFRRYFCRYDWMLNTIAKAEKAYSQGVSSLLKLAADNPFRVFIICPDTMPPAKSVTRNADKINQTLDLGYRKVETFYRPLGRFLGEPILGEKKCYLKNTPTL
jgi:predicted patatin/cPLA2 family phospholipase